MWTAAQFIDATLASPASMLLLLGALVAGWYICVPSPQVRALASLPRPRSTLPVLGNTLDLMFKQRARFHDWITDECARHNGKPWLLTAIGRPPSIVLSTADAFEDVLQLQFKTFEKGPAGRMIAKDMFGDGIFGADGVQWLHQRKTASHLFSLQMMRDIMERVILEETAVLCKRLDTAATAASRFSTTTDGEQQEQEPHHKPIDLKDLMDRLTTEIFVRIGFGIQLGCLQDKQESEFFQAFSRCPQAIHSRIQQPMWLWRLKRFLDIGVEKQLRLDMAYVNSKIYALIADSMAHKATSGAQHKDLISLFVAKEGSEYVDSDGKTVRIETTPQLVRDVAFNFIAAGRGTTAHSLEWYIVMLNRYPHVLERVREELQAHVPALCSGAQTVATMADVQPLVYLEASIRESLRLNPPAPANGRTANQDTTLRDGTFLKAGTRAFLPTYAASRMVWMWGDDALEFKPERWIDAASGKLKTISPFQFTIFHAGPRTCLGIKLAMMELKIVLATMLSRYDFATLRDPFDVSYDTSISLPIKGPLLVHVTHASARRTDSGMSGATAKAMAVDDSAIVEDGATAAA